MNTRPKISNPATIAALLLFAASINTAPALAEDRNGYEAHDVSPDQIEEASREHARQANEAAVEDATRAIEADTQLDLDIRLIGRTSVRIAATSNTNRPERPGGKGVSRTNSPDRPFNSAGLRTRWSGRQNHLPFFVREPETAPCRIGPLNNFRFSCSGSFLFDPAQMIQRWRSRWISARSPRYFAPWLLMLSRSFLNQLFAQANSTPRIARPTGITTIAGPGATIITTPTASTVLPTTSTAIRRATL